jgi:hypothetical protein
LPKTPRIVIEPSSAGGISGTTGLESFVLKKGMKKIEAGFDSEGLTR